MEEKIFPSPAVAEELENYVEARLHTDGPPNRDANVELQVERTSSRANPIYLIVNPWTEKTIDRIDGLVTLKRFAEFLHENADAARATETARR